MTSNEEPDYEPLEMYMNAHRDEIIDCIGTNTRQQFTPTDQMFDRLANQVTREFPYGVGIDNMHRFLTNAIMCTMWCGWFAQARIIEKDQNFNPRIKNGHKIGHSTSYKEYAFAMRPDNIVVVKILSYIQDWFCSCCANKTHQHALQLGY